MRDVEVVGALGSTLADKWTRERRHYLRKAKADTSRRDYWEGAALALTKCRAEFVGHLLTEIGMAVESDRERVCRILAHDVRLKAGPHIDLIRNGFDPAGGAHESR